jgi:hypothetical protein
MTERSIETSPQIYARIGGVLYLIIIVFGLFAELFVRDKLIVSGDATATANNIVASESLWRVSIASELMYLGCAVALTVIFYVLLGPVSNSLALLAAFFNLISIAIQGVSTVTLFAAVSFLGGASYLRAFDTHQLQALAYLSVRLYNFGFGVCLVFFGFCLLLYGYLIFKSGYFPKFLGILVAIAGLSYLVNSFVLFLAPRYAGTIFPILILAFIGELSLCLWLMVFGVNVVKWEEKQHALT